MWGSLFCTCKVTAFSWSQQSLNKTKEAGKQDSSLRGTRRVIIQTTANETSANLGGLGVGHRLPQQHTAVPAFQPCWGYRLAGGAR